MTFQGTRYQICVNGDVFRVNTERESQEYGLPSLETIPHYESKAVRREAARQRRNRNARERHQAHLDLGQVRTAYGYE